MIEHTSLASNLITDDLHEDIENKIVYKKQDAINKILNIFYKDMIEIIEETSNEQIKEIREQSKLGQIYKEIEKYANKKIKENYPNNYEAMKDKIYISFDNNEEITHEIEEIIDEKHETIKGLRDTLKDVSALLAITETYEQKVDILRRYKILDEDGMLV